MHVRGSNRLHRFGSRLQQTAIEWPAVRAIILHHTRVFLFTAACNGLNTSYCDVGSKCNTCNSSEGKLSEKGKEGEKKRARKPSEEKPRGNKVSGHTHSDHDTHTTPSTINTLVFEAHEEGKSAPLGSSRHVHRHKGLALPSST